MRNHLEYPKAIGWAMALAVGGILLTASVLGAQGVESDVVDIPEATDVRPIPPEANDFVPIPDANDVGTEGKLESVPYTPGTNPPAAPFVPRQTWPDGCGVSVNGVLGTCQGTNCANWDAGNRIYRGGVLMTCEAPVGCTTYSASTNVYDAYYYESPTPNAECNCIEIVFNNGGCGVSVHSALYAGIVTQFPTFSCSSAGNYQGLADQGSSLAATYSGELIPGGPTNNPGMYTILNMSNFGTGSRGCTYDYSIVCRSSSRSECALAPIEAKIDNLVIGPTPTGKKTMLCHVPPGNPDNAHIIVIGTPAVDPHLRLHGDCLKSNMQKGDPCTCP